MLALAVAPGACASGPTASLQLEPAGRLRGANFAGLDIALESSQRSTAQSPGRACAAGARDDSVRARSAVASDR